MQGGLEPVEIACPYCGEAFSSLVDCSAGSQEYVEDCQICCQPILLRLQVDAWGKLEGLEAERENS